jgi:hemerythrin
MILVEMGGDLILGVKQIDEHHEQLVNILHRCYSSLLLHNLETIIEELRDYTHYHFETE